MKYLIEDFFDIFQCAGSACPDTCCAGWKINVDSETAKAYCAVPGEMGEKLRTHISFDEDSAHIILREDGTCPFWTDKHLCEIYQKLGEEMQCLVCKTYPRIVEQHGDVFFTSLTCSCPEVARMLIERTEPLQFIEWDDGDDWSETPGGRQKPEEAEQALFHILMPSLLLSVRILQERRYPLSVRLRLLLLFTDTLQQRLDEGRDIADILEHFSSPERYDGYAKALSGIPQNIPARLSAFSVCLENSEKLAGDYHHSSLTRILASLKADLCSLDGFSILERPEYDIQYEHYAVYQMYRFYMRALKTKKPMHEAAVLIYTLNLLKCIAAMRLTPDTNLLPQSEQIRIFCEVSANFDHNSEHAALLYDIYGEKAGDISLLTALT